MTITMGELFAQRKFAQVNGKYVPGQYAAKKVSQIDAIVSYVDPMCSICIIPVEKIEDEWFHRRVLLMVGMNFAEVRELPRGFALTDPMVRALQVKRNATPK